MLKILLSSVGRRVELVRSFQRAFRETGIAGEIVGTDVDWLAPALQVVDHPRLVPSCHDPSFPSVILELCVREGVHAILPLIDPEIPVYAGLADQFRAHGIRLGVVDSAAAEITGDKWRTVAFFRQL
ncbi:MAG TPA: hypothetical protein VIY86_04220 [Pirellulaceae bacterium]